MGRGLGSVDGAGAGKVMESVAILGSGVMGCDLAILCARHGFAVRLWHRSDSDVAAQRWHRRVASYLVRGILTDEEARQAETLTEFTTSIERATDTPWILESVVEDMSIKCELLAWADRVRATGSVLMSNTSSLPLDKIENSLGRSDSFLGVHFFNPALKIHVVEVACVLRTEMSCVLHAEEWLRRIGKDPVRVRARPGFVVNRLMAGLIQQAFRLWEDGVASAGDIDRLAVGALGHPIGPLALADLVGLDVINAILTSLSRDIPDSALNPPRALQALIAEGKLGRKTGTGVHAYPQKIQEPKTPQ